jgi:hypothetical protein
LANVVIALEFAILSGQTWNRLEKRGTELSLLLIAALLSL